MLITKIRFMILQVFLTADMNWKSMAVSCLLLKKHYGSVTLYCNGSVKEIVSELKIPYDEIVVIPDFMQEYKGCNLWALPKIYTYSQQKTPFCMLIAIGLCSIDSQHK